MPTDDLTPEQWEDLVESDHSCDEHCYRRHHDDPPTEVLDPTRSPQGLHSSSAATSGAPEAFIPNC